MSKLLPEKAKKEETCYVCLDMHTMGDGHEKWPSGGGQASEAKNHSLTKAHCLTSLISKAVGDGVRGK